VPIDLNPRTLTRDPWDQDALLDLFEELEFRTLGRRLGLQREASDEVSAKPAPTKKVELASNDQMSLFGEPQATAAVTERLQTVERQLPLRITCIRCVETLPEARRIGPITASRKKKFVSIQKRPR
jgi:hypothetical protein